MRQEYVKDTIIHLIYDAAQLSNEYFWDSSEINEINQMVEKLQTTLEKNKMNYYDEVMIMEDK